MNNVFVGAEGISLPFPPGGVQDFAKKVLERIDHDNWDLSVLFCGDASIRELNRQYREKDEATDVLSFSLGAVFQDDKGEERYLPGDIVISLETVKENAEYFGVPMDEELKRLIIHGILHLDGLDHESNEKDEPMLEIQETILAEFREERIYL